MPGAFEIVMEDRRKLVEKIAAMMEKGYQFTAPEWNQAALRPVNPLSGVKYKGGNRLRLMNAVMEQEYKDPRWMTSLQLKKAGYYIRKGERGILCEKWIFEKEVKKIDEYGKEVRVCEALKQPVVSYFIVFNGEQVAGFPKYIQERRAESETMELAGKFIAASECPVIEAAQTDAFYVPSQDKICIPLRESFKDEISFAKTIFHEMNHSTGHESRLNRNLKDPFGSPGYAREELRAELGALFVENELGIQLNGEHFQDHSNYLKSWIGALKEDPGELFRAAADAEKSADRLVGNYCRKYNLNLDVPKEKLPVPPKEPVHKKQRHL